MSQKQVNVPNANVKKFGFYFKTMQENFNRCIEILPEIGADDEETAVKLLVGMRVFVRKMLERVGE